MSEENVFNRLKSVQKSTKNEPKIRSKEKFVEFCIEEVFRVTNIGTKKDLYDTLKYINRPSLALDSVDDILMEQLGLYEAKTFNRLAYLKGCVSRCKRDSLISSENVDPVVYDPKIVSELCVSVVRYAITYVLEPSIFNSTQSGYEVFDLISSVGCDPDSYTFLSEIRNKLEPKQYKQFFDQALIVGLGKLRFHTLYITDPNYVEVADLLDYFTSDEQMATVLVESSTFYPLMEDKSADAFFNTLFGQLFNAVCTHTYHKNPIYFNMKTMSSMEVRNTQHSISTALAAIYDRFSLYLKRLLVHPRLKNYVFCWFYGCLSAHAERCTLKASVMGSALNALDGFFANIAYVALKILQPITCDLTKLITRVDQSYTRCNHMFNASTEISYALTFSDEPSLKNGDKVAPIEKSFNFATHWFFLVDFVFKIGMIPAFDSMLKIEMELAELTTRMQDDESQEHPTSFRPVEFLRDEVACRRTQLCSKSLLSFTLEYCSAVSVFLLNIIGLDVTRSFEDVLTHFSPDSSNLSSIPAALLDQVASAVILIAKLANYVLSESEDKLLPLALCFCLLMGRKDCVSNPHLRAKLAEALCHLTLDPDITTSQTKADILTDRSAVLRRVLPLSLVQLFVDIEFTGHANEFDQKFTYRFYMYQILFRIWRVPEYVVAFRELSAKLETSGDGQLPLPLRFVNLLTNDATFLLDEALTKLYKIHLLEHELAAESIEESEKKQKLEALELERKIITSYNILSRDTIMSLKLLAMATPAPLLNPAMVDRIAVMLNFFLRHLVGEKKRELKVRDMARLRFEPRELVTIICEILVSLAKSDAFCLAVVADERSFNESLPDLALEVLEHINADSVLVERFRRCRLKLLEMYQNKILEEIAADDIPDEFLDPIASMLIRDPVMLPQSKMIVDRNTITKHLLSDETDPFNRSHLTLTMVIPQPELKARIDKWLRDRHSPSPH